MKLKNVLYLGMAAILAYFCLSCMAVYAQEEIAEETLWESNTEDTAFKEREESGANEFEIENGILVKYTGTDENVRIPDGIMGIGDYAFKQNDSLESVILPDSVTAIGNGAFVECENLKQINFPAHLAAIGHMAFYHCRRLEAAVFPKELGMIGEEAFYGCWTLQDIQIPGDVKAIGNGAFASCMGLTSVAISDGVERIGAGAFYRCMDLKTVLIPDSVTDIDVNAFDMIVNLTIYGADNSYAQKYAAENNILFSLKKEIKPGMPAPGDSGTTPETPVPDDNEIHVHSYTSEITRNPGCTNEGIRTYTCSECKNIYMESIPAAGHKYDVDIVQATASENGSMIKYCSKCGEESSTPIYAVKTIKLSQTSYTYNGKEKKPSIIVRDSKGMTLKSEKDYTVFYPKGMKHVGCYTVEVKFKGNYQGTIERVFTIMPQGSRISQLSSKSKGFRVKWKKQKIQTTGYEIAFSTSSKFTKKTTNIETVRNNKTVFRTMSALKPRKRYYVRIRTYKTIKSNGKSVKLYSVWSKAKSVKTRK